MNKVKVVSCWLFFITLVLQPLSGFSQSTEIDSSEVSDKKKKVEYYWSYEKEVGLNFTPLISSLVPFNLGETSGGFSNFKFKKYGRKLAFRLNMGIESDPRESFEEGFALFVLGYERRRPLSKKWTYTSGIDFGIFGFFDQDVNWLLSPFYGFEYNFNDHFFVSAEGNIEFLFGFNGGIRVNPPVAIFFNARI